MFTYCKTPRKRQTISCLPINATANGGRTPPSGHWPRLKTEGKPPLVALCRRESSGPTARAHFATAGRPRGRGGERVRDVSGLAWSGAGMRVLDEPLILPSMQFHQAHMPPPHLIDFLPWRSAVTA